MSTSTDPEIRDSLAPASSPVHFYEFVGRRAELGFLAERFGQARDGQGSMVLLAGESGIGKTRLIAEFRTSLGSAQSWTAVGTCVEFIQAPYLPFREIWSTLFGADSDPMYRDPLASTRHEGADELQESSEYENQQKLQTFMRVSNRLRDLSKVRPLVMVLEDIHWADNATQDLLEYLVGSLPRSRSLLIATYRTELLSQQPWLEALVGRLERRHAYRLHLKGLSEHDTHKLVRQVLHNRELSSEAIEPIIELAEGNPLFLEELLRAALDTEDKRFEPGEASRTSLRGVILRRVHQLTKGQQRLITLAAVFGRSFEPAFVADIAESPLNHVLDTLRRARQLQIIRRDPVHTQRYEFRHALTRHILYSELLPAQTLALHARIARKLESHPEQHPVELAFHWAAAGNVRKAVHYNEAAGDIAAQVLAFRDAARMYRRALDFETDPGPARTALCFKLANSLSSGGLPESARPWYEEALQTYEATGDIENQVITLLLLARQYWLGAQTEASLPLLRRAIKLADALPHSRLQHDTRVKMANTFCLFGKYEEAEKFVKAAEDLKLADGPLSSTYHNCVGITLANRGKPALAFKEFRKAIRAARLIDDVYLETVAYNDAGTAAVALGRLRLAVRLRQRALSISLKRGTLWRSAYLSLHLARVWLLLGQLPATKELVLQSIESGSESAGVRILRAAVGIPLALLLEDNDLLQACVDTEALELALRTRETDRVGPAAAAFVELCFSRGHTPQAKTIVHQSLEALSTANQAWDLLVWCAQIGDNGDVARARALLLQESAISGHVMAQAYVHLFDGVLAQRERRRSMVAKHARAAEVLFHRLGMPMQRARALELCEQPAEALAIYRSVGSNKDEKRLTQSHGVRRQSRMGTGLTQREHDIAVLVTEGLTNRMIGVKLGISENTVEHHLDSIFNRLGIRSRARLAALMTEKGSAT